MGGWRVLRGEVVDGLESEEQDLLHDAVIDRSQRQCCRTVFKCLMVMWAAEGWTRCSLRMDL